MSRIEYLKEQLYKLLETDNINAILVISQELDEHILAVMEKQLRGSKKSA